MAVKKPFIGGFFCLIGFLVVGYSFAFVEKVRSEECIVRSGGRGAQNLEAPQYPFYIVDG